MAPRFKYELPSMSFPYKITRRLNTLAHSQRVYIDQDECMPLVSERGVRVSALKGRATDRVNEAAYPYLRRILILNRMYKDVFDERRRENIQRLIEAANACMYTKLANCAIGLRKADQGTKKKRGWTESEWKKHTDYIMQIAKPKPMFFPDPIERGPRKALPELMVRVNKLAQVSDLKAYKRLSQEAWYRNPTKVRPAAMKYVITEHIKKLAKPKAPPPEG